MNFDIFDKTLVGVSSLSRKKKEIDDRLYIPEDIITIGEYALSEVNNFKSVKFPDSLCYIRKGAFYNCGGLEELEIPSSVVLIEDGAFAGCKNLKKLTINGFKGKIWGNFCFNCCEQLKWLVIDGIQYRLFYFPSHIQFAKTVFDKKIIKKDNEYIEIYKGCFTGDNFPLDDIKRSKETVFFAVYYKNDKEYIWYDIDEDMAITGAEYQASGLSYIDFFGKEITPDSSINANELSMLIGCCYDGLKYWNYFASKLTGKEEISRTLPIPIKDVINIVKRYFPVAGTYLYKALNSQHVPNKKPLFENGIARATTKRLYVFDNNSN